MFKQLMGYIQQYRKYFILAPLLVVGESLAELILPYLMGKIVDDGVQNGDIPYMLIVGGIMVVVAALGIVKKLDMLPLYFSIGVSNGILPLLAYNYASGNNERRHRVFKLGCGVSVAFSLLCVLLGSHAD